MEIRKQRIWIHKDEILDTLEMEKDGKLKYYSYTYKIRGKQGRWIPQVRWDNHDQAPHVDRYDENNALIDQTACREKPLKEVLKLVGIFRRNLMSMDIAEL